MLDYALIDGNNLAFRSFYGIKDLSNGEMPVNAIYGFFNSLLGLIKQIAAKKLIVCFDCGRSEKRTQLLSEYKANRVPTPDGFKVQLNYIKQMIPLMGGFCWEKSGIEADDLISSWSTFASNRQQTCIIISADKDLMQCVNPWVSQMIPTAKGWSLMNRSEVLEKMGVYPEQIVDYLALMGDNADNYPGIPGVGPKTAAKWLSSYGSISNIYKNITSLSPERFQEVLRKNEPLLKNNQTLASLEASTVYAEEIADKLNECKPHYEELVIMLEDLHLNKLANKFKDFCGLSLQQIELF